jgi:hypothetical protein
LQDLTVVIGVAVACSLITIEEPVGEVLELEAIKTGPPIVDNVAEGRALEVDPLAPLSVGFGEVTPLVAPSPEMAVGPAYAGSAPTVAILSSAAANITTVQYITHK